MAKLVKDDQVLNMQNINVPNDSVVDQNLSLLPMEIFENTNSIKLQDKNLRNGSNNRNIYNCDQVDIMTSPTEKRIINFFNWRVRLNKKGHLIVVGTLDGGNFARSKPINKRLTATNVESIFNNTYHLNGNLVDYWDELPDYIRFKFFDGFPEDWENVTDIWKLFVTQGSNSDFHWPTFEYMKKGQTQNALKFKVHSCTFCGQKCDGEILKTKNNNNICDKIYAPSLRDSPSSNIIEKIYNINNNNLDKEILNKYENINDNQLPHLPKEKKMVNLKDDRQNAVITNLLNKGVPEDHVSKIIEILDFDNNILLSKISSNIANNTQVQNNEVINNFDKSYNVPLLKKSPQDDPTKNNVEETHKTSRIVLREKQNVTTESGKINDMLLHRSNKENSEKFESNAYAIKPKIISDKLLLNKEVLVKRHKRGERRERKFYNHTIRNSKTYRESMTNDREIHHFDFGFNNIESDVERHDSLNLSESVDTDERNRDNMKYYTKASNKRKSDSFFNNPNSSIEESKQKKHRNKKEMIEHSVEIPKIRKKFVDANQLDAIKRTSKNNTVDNDNQMVSLQQKQNITSAHLSIVKSPISKNYYYTNANENITNDKLKSTSVLYNTKDINKNAYILTSDEEIESDDEIYDNKCNSKENNQMPRSNDIQTECDIGLSLLTSYPGTNAIDTSKNKILKLKKPKLLSDWIPRIISDSSLPNGFSLVFEGQLLNDVGHTINRKFKTHPVHKRLSATLIEDINQDIYQLVGNLHNKHVVPKRLMKYCLHGCPININKFCKMWKSYEEADTNQMVTKQEDKIKNELSITTSSRGRKIFPPLDYWTGERVVSKDEETIYTAGNIPKRSKDANTSSEIMEIKEKIYESFNKPGSSKISKQINDLSKDANFKLLPRKVLKKAEVRLRCDLQLSNQHEVNKDNNTVLQSDEHSNQCDKKQQLSTKKINLKYSYNKNVPMKDDVLSDDHAF